MDSEEVSLDREKRDDWRKREKESVGGETDLYGNGEEGSVEREKRYQWKWIREIRVEQRDIVERVGRAVEREKRD